MRLDAPTTARSFAAFRIVFGLYLAVHFASLIPHARELFSSAGMLPDSSLLPTAGLFPNLLFLTDTPGAATAWCLGLAVIATAFAAGWQRRLCALALWYGWACLLGRNPFIANPGIPYVGWLLLACAVIPSGEALRPERADPRWQMPGGVYIVALSLMAVGYTASGLHKLGAPSWRDGTAILHVLQTPLARPSWLRAWLVDLPPACTMAMTYGVLALEILAAPLLLWRRSRRHGWVLLTAMHAGILLTLDFADLTFGMLMIHLFVVDPAWRPRTGSSRSRPDARRLAEAVEHGPTGTSTRPASCRGFGRPVRCSSGARRPSDCGPRC